MDTETETFWIAVIGGVVVMLAFAAITVNVWHFLPVVNPFIGGFVTGILARRSPLGGAKESVVAGVGGGMIVFLDYLLGSGLMQSVTVPMATLAGSLLLVIVIPYSAILALIGGIIGGQVKRSVISGTPAG